MTKRRGQKQKGDPEALRRRRLLVVLNNKLGGWEATLPSGVLAKATDGLPLPDLDAMQIARAAQRAPAPGEAPFITAVRAAIERVHRRAAADEAAGEKVRLTVVEMLKARDRRLHSDRWLADHPDHRMWLAQIFLWAAKDCGLAYGEPIDLDALDEIGREALRCAGHDIPDAD